LPGGIQIGLGAKTNGKGHLVFLRQNRNLGHAVYIGVQAPYGTLGCLATKAVVISSNLPIDTLEILALSGFEC
jgi:hypothetical protein